MKKQFRVICLLTALFCLAGFLRTEEPGKQYDEFTFPDTLSIEEREKKINALFDTLRRTTWEQYPHEFNTPEEKRAYRTQGCYAMIQAYKTLVAEDAVMPQYLYRICYGYYLLYNDTPESERPALLEKLKQDVAPYNESERFKDIVADIHDSIKVFPFHQEILKPDGRNLKDHPLEEQKQLIRRFYEFLKTNQLPLTLKRGSLTQEYVDAILYGFTWYLEVLADKPAEKEYVISTLKDYCAILQQYERDRIMQKIVERLEMTGKTCPWKLPVFNSDEVIDFSKKRGRISLITFFPVFRSHTLHLQYAERLWKDQGLDIYCVDHRYAEYLDKTLAVIGLDWTTFQQIPEDVPDGDTYRFLKRYMGVYENDDACILIDRDGTVLDSNLLQKNVIDRLEEIFGKAPYDITEKADAFINAVSGGEFQKLLENCPPGELRQRLADVSLVTYRRSGGSNLQHGDALLDLAMQVYEKSTTEQDRAFAVDVILYYTKWFENFGKTKQEFLAAAMQKMEVSGQTRLADKIRWALYLQKFDWDMEVEKFAALRDEVFQYLIDHPASVIPEDLYSLLNKMAEICECVYACKSETVRIAGETCLACSKMLSGSENKDIKQQAENMFTLARRLLLVGKEMPVSGVTLEGTPLKWDNYAGKVVLIDFWATWCGPCIGEIPKVKKHYEKYHNRGFDVIGISTDTDFNALAEFLQKNDIPWLCLADKKLEEQNKITMAKTYAVTSIPEMILIGRDGKVVLLNARGEVLEEKLAELFPAGE